MGKNEISVSWLYVSLPCLQLILNSYGLVTQSNELLSLLSLLFSSEGLDRFYVLCLFLLETLKSDEARECNKIERSRIL